MRFTRALLVLATLVVGVRGEARDILQRSLSAHAPKLLKSLDLYNTGGVHASTGARGRCSNDRDHDAHHMENATWVVHWASPVEACLRTNDLLVPPDIEGGLFPLPLATSRAHLLALVEPPADQAVPAYAAAVKALRGKDRVVVVKNHADPEVFSASVFCLTPFRYGWSPLLYSALRRGCVPIFLHNDHSRKPFDQLIDFDDFSLHMDEHPDHWPELLEKYEQNGSAMLELLEQGACAARAFLYSWRDEDGLADEYVAKLAAHLWTGAPPQRISCKK